MGAITRAAEGLDRRAFTVSEVLRMQEAGVFGERERFELIDGEIVVMQARGPLHERLKSAFNYEIVRALPNNLWFGVETTLYLSNDTFLDPDLIVFPREHREEGPRGGDVLLAIEVAVSSLAYDRGVKAQLYAKHGIKEYWVVDAARRATYQLCDPHGGEWRKRVERSADETLTHPALPGFSIRLSDY